MKEPFSIVVICKNEAGVIKHLLESAQNLTDNVVVYDNGSTDDTATVVQQYKNAHLHRGPWEGFGKTKQKATALAQHNWVLSLDADEAPDEALQQQLQQWTPQQNTVYNIRFKNLLGSKHLQWGEWGFDSHIRLFNRQQVQWNNAPVHEELEIPTGFKVQKLNGSVIHRTVKDSAEYSQKMVKYALLNAEKYHARGKRATWPKRYFSPLFAFVKFYIFMLGFLDGWEGLLSARMTSFYTFLKYARLHELGTKAPEKH